MEDEEPPASWMSTHAIKTELWELLMKLHPEKGWPKRVSVTQLCDYAVHAIPADTNDQDAQRALRLAKVLYDHERR